METEEIPIYSDGKFYDVQTDLKDDIPFYMEQAENYGEPILELACGTGRLTIPIAEEGYDITGLDISKDMLEVGRKKAEEKGLSIDWIEGDMRDFELDKEFDLIFLPYNSINHLTELASIERLFESVREHLSEDGRFVFDTFNPSLSILNRDPDMEFHVNTFEDPDDGKTIDLSEKTEYRSKDQILKIKWIYRKEGYKEIREWENRMIFPKELDALLKYNGFSIEEKYGSFEKQPFEEGSKKQICICREK